MAYKMYPEQDVERREDENDNGIPDWQERTITTTRENPDGSRTVDRMKLQPRAEAGPAAAAPAVQPAAPAPARKMMDQAGGALQQVADATMPPPVSARNAFRARTLYGADRAGSLESRREQSASAVDQLMGMGAGERQRGMMRLGEPFLEKTVPAALAGDAQVAAAEATAQGMQNQGLAAANVNAAERRFQTQTEATSEANKLAENVRQFDQSRNVTPLVVNGQTVGLTVNGQVVDLRRKTQEGFFEMTDQNGNVTGAMTKDGVVLRKTDNGEWMVDRPNPGVVIDPKTGQAIAVTGGARPLPAQSPFAGMGGAEAQGAVKQGGAAGVPAVGSVRNGYQFLGGNPNDPKAWRKI